MVITWCECEHEGEDMVALHDPGTEHTAYRTCWPNEEPHYQPI